MAHMEQIEKLLWCRKENVLVIWIVALSARVSAGNTTPKPKWAVFKKNTKKTRNRESIKC